MLALLTTVIADVGGTGGVSHVNTGAWLTLVLPLALLVVVLCWWWLVARRGWPPLPTSRHPAPPRHRWQRRHKNE